MAWDRTRPVPWPRLVRQFAVYLLLFNVALFIFARDDYGPGVILGSVGGAVVYLGISVVLVKFGWNPPGGLRPGRGAAGSTRSTGGAGRSWAGRRRSAAAPDTPAPRTPPAPTKRTGGGRPPSKRR
ncbi:MAG: hypothetical protein ACKO91_04540 [Acidimicrobiales bacterium]